MNIDRDLYLTKLKSKRHNKMIKIITGLRKSGKSYLLIPLFIHKFNVLNCGQMGENVI